jgi:peptidoglycan hydrolase-like protein with peptidoglycan-binding domain
MADLRCHVACHGMRFFLATALALAPSPAAARPACEAIAVWRDGKHAGTVCRAEATARGLTVIDLRDDWVPPILAAAPDGTGPGYRTTYVALAQERFADAGADGEHAARDRYLELFGIAPSLGVVRARLGDEPRHRCHAAIDDAALAAFTRRIAEEPIPSAKAKVARARALRAWLDAERARRKLPDLDALGAKNASFRRTVALLAAREARLAAVRAIQAHLACDGLLQARPIDAAYTWQTSTAVERFQRGAMLVPTAILDAPTRAVLALDSRERDLRTALRVLRARVTAATGLIEDGTAGAGPGTVLGRALELDAAWGPRGHTALAGAAPDLISRATEAAARALGWRDVESVRAFLDRLASAESASRLVAVPLPARPAYHGPRMQLSIEIDRGDVWRDPVPRWRAVKRRPALIVYTTSGDRRIPLARWPTTIGGWQAEKGIGITRRWKESPVGPRIWRDLYVGPVWLPPASTPDRELVRPIFGRYVLARERLGPSYRAAFGMISFVHLAEARRRGRVETYDQGIRTHGTGNVASLANGTSHGCHRLLGLHAVRLASFVLAHREHVRHGDARTYYRRVVRYGGSFRVSMDSLGYRIELASPLPVEVLPGRVHR